VFVIEAIDDVGDYTPYLSLFANVLWMHAGYPQLFGPKITVFTDYFYYQYSGATYWKDTASVVKTTAPSGFATTFNWSAQPTSGRVIRSYRWVLDPVVLDDETPRSGPDDVHHWTERSALTTSATIGPFSGAAKGETHRLYIEADDDLGGVSVATIEITTRTPPATHRPLLIVDDTRFTPDQYQAGQPKPPGGDWPTAAELDTFLYAKGGVPWRGYPAGTLSSAGVFAGYDYDTLGTRTGNIDLTVPLATLAKYSHVIWLTERTGAAYANSGNLGLNPMTALRYMTAPGHVNTLAQYVAAGGHVWVAGGGIAYASQIAYNDLQNDVPGAGAIVFQSWDPFGQELVPGRFMYDIPRWQSQIHTTRLGTGSLTRFTGRFGDTDASTGPGSPYVGLPATMRFKSPALDPLPPLRTAGAFYLTSRAFECITFENYVLDNAGQQPVLDSLYEASGGGLPGPYEGYHSAAMTIYRGGERPPFVCSGFDLWSHTRQDCVSLVDFVLQNEWGLSRGPLVSVAPGLRAPDSAPRAAKTAVGLRAQRGLRQR